MKLASRDVFEWRDSRWRLVSLDPEAQAAWIIDLNDRHAWPIKVARSTIADCEREARPAATTAPQPSEASRQKLEEDYARLQLLLAAGTDLFEKNRRKAIIARVADERGCCRKTLEKILRRYWQRGMTKEALLPDYKNCGRRQSGGTAGRGRRPRRKYDIYQVTEDDYPRFKAVADAYFADPRRALKATFDQKVGEQYNFEDGNGNRYVAPPGSRPTFRQFCYWFKKEFGLELRNAKRLGKKEYVKVWKPKLSDTIADCAGAGHRYELDATIGDVSIVHAADPATIIGKATVYFIVDRRSRLIVGFYVGLENPCWETAVEAIVSLTEDKQALCERYGVEYDPADWPADGILPSEILADNAEGMSRQSSELPRQLSVTIANTPSLLPHFKPNVETRFDLITTDIRNTAPGYEPPEDRYKRRTKHYDKEACLTLHEFIREILEAVIKHNRKPLQKYPRSPDQKMRGVEPSPIALWNDEVQQRGCLGRRFDAEAVLVALLPQATATVTHEGLKFKGLYYVSDDARLQYAFAKARDGRSSVKVSYDRRCVDFVYVHLPHGVVLATLSSKNHGYQGLSFREVDIVDEEAKQQSLDFEQKALQINLESTERRAHSIRKAERRRDALGALSARSRRANTVAARQEEKRNERSARADRLKAESRIDAIPMPSQSNVTGLPVQNRKVENDAAAESPAKLVRRRMGQ